MRGYTSSGAIIGYAIVFLGVQIILTFKRFPSIPWKKWKHGK